MGLARLRAADRVGGDPREPRPHPGGPHRAGGAGSLRRVARPSVRVDAPPGVVRGAAAHDLRLLLDLVTVRVRPRALHLVRRPGLSAPGGAGPAEVALAPSTRRRVDPGRALDRLAPLDDLRPRSQA